jgi:hypothetical protein
MRALSEEAAHALVKVKAMTGQRPAPARRLDPPLC